MFTFLFFPFLLTDVYRIIKHAFSDLCSIFIHMFQNSNVAFLLILDVFRNQNEINVNIIGGHLLRSKESFRDETGVAAGFGALDSPLLT